MQISDILFPVPDSFLRSRSGNDHEATLMIKTQFMSFWDGLSTDPSCQVMIMGASNRPHDVDAAILRRMPCMFRIGMPVSFFFSDCCCFFARFACRTLFFAGFMIILDIFYILFLLHFIYSKTAKMSVSAL